MLKVPFCMNPCVIYIVFEEFNDDSIFTRFATKKINCQSSKLFQYR
jgi:hypothetical protein